ncbi:autotransporter outer membrane beta-barrel domain-containing protein [Thalassospira sp.]|uniref:autotransporter outer membrane beta-barrel domain-containing protein n=1 Tax=Thalassospira sp. TaxID=1912094 RepID=UPI0025D99CEF|nr:autotransporter outer membrane beta-barrel domain-containing protein [Thalassospira sp.]
MNVLKYGTGAGLVTALLGTVALTSPAYAISSGCTYLNGVGSVTADSPGGRPTKIFSSLSFDAGEVVRVRWTNNSTTFAYAELLVGSNNAGSGQVLANGGTLTLEFTVTSQLTNVNVETREPTLSGNAGSDYLITPSCTAPAEETSETGSETTSKSVTSAVSRSQTTVIQQNIGARVATVIGNSNGGTVNPENAGGNAANNGRIGAPSADDSSSFTQLQLPGEVSIFEVVDDDHTQDSEDMMRSLAMRASFDSSEIAADMAHERSLALGPTDQGSVGGASGVDGRTALAGASPITVWGHGSYTAVDNDYNDGTSDNRYDGDVWGYNLGADYRFANNVIAGLSLGYNDTDLTTTFNNGTYKEAAWVASPYVIFSPIANLNIVGEAGYSQGDIDVTRNNGSVTGSTDSAMWYASVKGVYAYRPLEDTPLTLSPSVSLLAARKTIDSYAESDGTFVDSSRSNTRQIKPAIEAAYDFGFNSLIITPFVETGMIHDFTDELNNDKTAFNVGGGVRLSDTGTGFNAALEGSYLAGRADYTEYTIAGTVSYGFELRDLDGQPVGLMTPFFGSDVDEYGNQSMNCGFGFNAGPMTSRLALAHDISQTGNAESLARISMTLDF